MMGSATHIITILYFVGRNMDGRPKLRTFSPCCFPSEMRSGPKLAAARGALRLRFFSASPKQPRIRSRQKNKSLIKEDPSPWHPGRVEHSSSPKTSILEIHGRNHMFSLGCLQLKSTFFLMYEAKRVSPHPSPPATATGPSLHFRHVCMPAASQTPEGKGRLIPSSKIVTLRTAPG